MRTSSGLKVGILAEDRTDCDTLKVLVQRMLAARGHTASFKHRGKDGAAHLVRKAKVWMSELADEGCTVLLLVHDLDRSPANQMLNDQHALRVRLDKIPVPKGVVRYICIPIEELEAWFWSCPNALERIAPGTGKDRVQSSPERLTKPKEALIRLSASQRDGKARYTTGQNPELAELLDLELCARRCPSFRDLHTFLAASVVSVS